MRDELADGSKLVFPCIIRAWNENETAVLRWLLKQTRDRQLAQDLLQELFIRMLQQKQAFCEVQNSRAWMQRVAKNLLIDHSRKRDFQPLEEDIEQQETEYAAVDLLAMRCLPRVISELDSADREIITECDLNGVKQQAFADKHSLSLPATKSRLKRAREKLKKQIECACQVRLDEDMNVCCFVPRDG